jgi:cytochrome c peroxidase
MNESARGAVRAQNGGRPRATLRVGVVTAGVLASAVAARAIISGDDLAVVQALHAPEGLHLNQADLETSVSRGRLKDAFRLAFEGGGRLFTARFNALDGGGANVGNGQRYTRVLRPDLAGPGEWATHQPPRLTGPNAQSCAECHNVPFEGGAGSAASMGARFALTDSERKGSPGALIERNAPHLFGHGALQRLAEEMTAELWAIRDRAAAEAAASGADVTRPLVAKGVSFGTVTARADGGIDTSRVTGLLYAGDLVVAPDHWQGAVPFIRNIVDLAAHNEIGMQPVELVGEADADGDGVSGELTVGDITAMTIYTAAQPRPTTRVELASLGLIPPLSSRERASIDRGERAFAKAGCTECHMKRMTIDDPIFSEPSRSPAHRFPPGAGPALDPALAVRFDLTRDTPENRVRIDSSGNLLGAFKRDEKGRAIVELYGDLKRHDMGPGLAEPADDVGGGRSVFLTENLWGVGSTAPYLHDGRATTLAEAIIEHGGEALASREAFLALGLGEQQDLIAFLENLVLFKLEGK